MKILFSQATLFLLDEANTILENGYLAVDGTKICYVGSSMPKGIFDRIIDCKGDIVMPGLVNAHAHSGMTLFRGLADDLPLDQWLFDCIFKMEDKLTPEDVYYGTQLAILESARAGITFVGDSYFFIDSMVEAYRGTGLRWRYLASVIDLNVSTESELIRLQEMFDRYHDQSDLFDIIPGAHSEYTCSEQLLSKVADFAITRHVPTYIHASETLKEVGECTVRHNGLTPIQFLHKLGYFENGSNLAHCVYADKDDIDIMAMSHVSCVHNPSSNLKLASGIAPIHSMIRHGVNVALGTDGAASNNALDIVKEMYLMSVLQKGNMHDASVVTAEQAVRAATINGAKSLFCSTVGQLQVGQLADIIRMDTSAPHMHPRNRLQYHLVYSSCRSDVVMTMVNGKIVYENGNYFMGIDSEKVYSECEKRIARILNE